MDGRQGNMPNKRLLITPRRKKTDLNHHVAITVRSDTEFGQESLVAPKFPFGSPTGIPVDSFTS